jgi:Predicted periplasmic ligand-binding sensor domain
MLHAKTEIWFRTHVIYEDSKKNIWVGTWEGGLHLLENPRDMENFRWKTYRHRANDPISLSDDIVYDICEDINTNSLWIGTQYGLGIWFNNGTGFIFDEIIADGKHLERSSMIDIAEDDAGKIWIATINHGMISIEGDFLNFEDFTFKNYTVKNKKITSNTINSLHFDTSGRLWAGAESGRLYLYDKESDSFATTSSFPGHPIAIKENCFSADAKD